MDDGIARNLLEAPPPAGRAALVPSWLPPGCLVAVGMRAEAALLPRGTRVVCAGGNPARLAAALAAEGGATAVLSFGIAGGLDLALRTGALLVATRVRGASGAWPADAAWAARIAAATGARPAVLAGAASVASNPAEKARLRAMTGGAAAVDLESEVAAAFAARLGLPFAALRAVADAASDALPLCAAQGLTPDGRPAVGRVLLGLLRRPGEFSQLLAVARASRAALTVLARAAA